MEPVTTEMLTIKAIDPTAALGMSAYTRMWYVSSNINITDGAMIFGVTEHRSTPAAAVTAFLDRLRSVDVDDLGHVIVTHDGKEGRRHWRWNGAAFANESVETFSASK